MERSTPLLERVIGAVSPAWGMRRERARLGLDMMRGLSGRTYEAAGHGRRTDNWHKLGTDANAVIGPGLSLIRAKARHLVRNNPLAESALDTLSTHIVGPYGITAKPRNRSTKVADAWKRWAESKDCDADGVNDFAGLQDLAVRTIVESGEVIIRRRLRYTRDGFAIPLQIQILEPDFIDTSKSGALPNGGGRIVHGVEFDAIGRRVAIWMFRDHPGSAVRTSALVGTSVRVPASEVRHVFKSTRAGQARAVSWFAPVLLKLSDFDEFDDATLMKQKIAACLSVFRRSTDPDATIGVGSPNPNGVAGKPGDVPDSAIDTLEPGMIVDLDPGEDITVVDPPATSEYDVFAKAQQRMIATGLGVTYEDLTGDYTGLPYSAARMSRIRHWAKVERWRWRMVIPGVCDPVFAWWTEAAILAGAIDASEAGLADWTAPPAPMLDPDKEVAAIRRRMRAGVTTPQEELRALGLEPADVVRDIAAWNKLIDGAGVVLDSDPRNMSEAGQRHSAPAAAPAPAPKGKAKKASKGKAADGENDDETDDTDDDPDDDPDDDGGADE